jgi:hypothetical protein
MMHPNWKIKPVRLDVSTTRHETRPKTGFMLLPRRGLRRGKTCWFTTLLLVAFQVGSRYTCRRAVACHRQAVKNSFVHKGEKTVRIQEKSGRVWRSVAILLALGVVAGVVLAAPAEQAVTIYTKDNVPKAPPAADLPQLDKVTQYGITWTFDRKAPVGQFVNGDYYVVGPVTVVNIDPKPLFGSDVPAAELDNGEKQAGAVRNGSMLNPAVRPEAATQQKLGFDSGIKNNFEASLAARLPIKMSPKDSLISTISLKHAEKCNFVMPGWSRGGRPLAGVGADEDNCPIRVAAVLTCVAQPLPPDAFRPGYCDRTQTIYFTHNLKRDKLPKLAPVGDKVPDPVKFAEVFQKPWVNLAFFGFDQPQENMPHYGQVVGEAVSDAGVLLCLDFKPEQKESLLINFVQVGIDYWSMIKSGHHGWEGWGGHGSGRKFPMVFAGFMLGDDQMMSPTKKFPKTEFGEDNQTMYASGWTGAKVVFAGHSGVSTITGQPPRPQWGPYEHKDPSKWDGENLRSELYRRANSSCSWVGEALVMRLLHLEPAWNHNAFFDYVDRWMYEDETAFRAAIGKAFPAQADNMNGKGKEWCHEGYTGDFGFVKPIWEKYRPTVQAPTDGWQGKK